MHWPKSITDLIGKEKHFGHRNVKCFTQRPADVNAVFNNALLRHPHSEAIVQDHIRLTYAQVESTVAEIAAGLTQNGVRKGDRVAMLLGNRVEFLTVLLATLRIGAIAVPINVREQTPELIYILNHCGAVLLVHEAEVEDRLPTVEETQQIKYRYSIGETTTAARNFADLSYQAPGAPATVVNEEDIAVILYTSGTTGRPKGAMLTHFNIVHSMMHFELCLGMQEGERSLLAVPASHVTGLVAILATTLRVAGCTVMLKTFDAHTFLSTVAKEKITQTVIVPAMYNLFLLRCNIADYDLSTWRIGAYGGAPMPESTIQALAEQIPQLLLVNAYGSTEATSPAMLMPPNSGRNHSDSIGIAVPCADIRVVDDQGNDVSEGEHGELWIAGPMMVPGYWKDPEKTQAEFYAGYWKSGDIGSRDKNGYYYLHDRRKDMIIRGGYNIYSAEIENVIAAIKGVIECAVIGRPDAVLGEKTEVVVCVNPASSPSDAQIIDYCRTRLADYKVPDFVTFSIDPLPRNANGKVIKRLLLTQTLV